MPRLFTGIELPDDAREALARLRMPLAGAKWIDPGEMHVTLRFAGDIDNARAADFADALAQIDVDCFEVRISGVGAFGGNDPRVVWAGVEGGEALTELARLHEKAAREAGLQPEPRAFKPHVTLARLRGGRVDAVARVLQHHGAFRLEPFVVERFVLYSSRPQLGGGPYVIEEAFPLRGGMLGDAHEHAH
jgi:2'-5' RNA ligase